MGRRSRENALSSSGSLVEWTKLHIFRTVLETNNNWNRWVRTAIFFSAHARHLLIIICRIYRTIRVIYVSYTELSRPINPLNEINEIDETSAIDWLLVFWWVDCCKIIVPLYVTRFIKIDKFSAEKCPPLGAK